MLICVKRILIDGKPWCDKSNDHGWRQNISNLSFFLSFFTFNAFYLKWKTLSFFLQSRSVWEERDLKTETELRKQRQIPFSRDICCTMTNKSYQNVMKEKSRHSIFCQLARNSSVDISGLEYVPSEGKKKLFIRLLHQRKVTEGKNK